MAIEKGKHLTVIKRICDTCPCLNTDYESGATCNLGYTSELIWVHKSDFMVEVADTTEMRSHQSDFELVQASDDCKLISIVTEGKTIIAESFIK